MMGQIHTCKAPAFFGLMARPRPYRCKNCGHVAAISTNHTDSGLFSECPGCSWKPSFGAFAPSLPVNSSARPSRLRPFYYVGPLPEPEEFNPYSKAPRLVERTSRAAYWLLPCGVYQATAPHALPPSGDSGYHDLDALKRLKGDS